MDSNNYSYFFIKDNIIDYLDSLQVTKDSSAFYSGGGEFKEFKFFEKLWEPRLTPHGDFTKFMDEEYDFYNYQLINYNYITQDAWHELGPNKVQTTGYKGIGPVEFITFFDNGTPQSTQYMLTGSTLGGLFYSTDYGISWNKTGSDNWVQSGCGWAVFHPTDHQTWFASSSGNRDSAGSLWIGKTGGIYKTYDEGQSWTQIADKDDLEGFYTTIYKLIMHPVFTNILYVATSKGIFKTTNCGLPDPTWTKILSGFVYDMEMKTNNNSVIYAAVHKDEYWKIWISQNDGTTWDEMSVQPEILDSLNLRVQYLTIEVSKAKPEFLYAETRNYNLYSFYYFDFINSVSWTNVGSHTDTGLEYGFGHGFGVEQINSGEDILVSKYLGIKKFNINSGFVGSFSTEHVDVEDIIYHPYNANEVWACTHGGVEKSTDGGQTWQARYNGLGVAQVERFASSYTNPEYILTGLYHDGVQLTDSDYDPNWNPIWKWVKYCDGMVQLIDNKNSNNMWGSGQKGDWSYSDNAFSTSPQGVSIGSTSFMTIGVLNKQNPSVLFRNKLIANEREEVFRSTDYGIGTTEIISSFNSMFPGNRKVHVVGLYTPYNNGDYLITYLFDETQADPKVKTWHVYRSTNVNDASSSVVWEELLIPRSTNTTLFEIEFDPYNPDIVYIAYSRSSDDNNPTGIIYKMDYSVPSNPIELDITKNLPLTVVREDCIVAEKGCNGGLYIATEFGIFYTNNEMLLDTDNEWKLVGTELPHVPSDGIEINYIGNTLRVATWGRGVWELPLPCLNNQQSYIIDDNTTWNSHMRFDRSIEINPGVILIIDQDARIALPPDGKIIIHQGAELFINGGTLTSACAKHWQGIQVWGNRNQSQYAPPGQPCLQGKLTLRNDAVIENAIIAVDLWKPGDHCLETGGIVDAKNAIFRDNAMSVRAMQYRNFHPSNPSVELDNFSNFENCTFEITSDYLDDVMFTKHVYFWIVKGIDFYDCDFSVNNEISGVSDWSQAIVANNAGLNVFAVCNSGTSPCTGWDKCTFTGFYNAIEAQSDGTVS